MNDIKLMNKAADNIRILAASMVEKAKSGHPGGAMGGADFVNVLFSEFLVYDPKNPAWEGRDRYFQDPGHMSPMLYSVLALAGKFTIDELKEFRQWGSVTPGHPEVNVMRGIENTSGPLGQGHTYAVGAAIAAKFLKARLGDVMNQTIYTYISDGGIQEEISQGAGRIAGTLGLDNLIMFYDANNIQLSTTVGEVTTENVAMKYEAWGWKVITINGNDVTEIRRALTEAKAETSRPTLIIGNTIMGKGAVGADKSSYENKVSTHGQPLSAAGVSIADTIRNLGGNPDDPFQIFPEVAELYAKRAKELEAIVAERYAAKAEWAKANPELAAKMDLWFSGKAPFIDWKAIEHKPNQATLGNRLRRAGNPGRKYDRFFSRPFQFGQDRRLPEENTCIRKRRFQWCIPSSRCCRTDDGLRMYRYVAPRRCNRSLRYVLRILRLHETRYPNGCPDGTAG